MKTTSLIFGAALAITVFSSCSKKASGPASVKFQLKASNPVAGLAARSTAATIQWNSGTATPTAVKFEAKKGTTEIEYTSTAGQQVNLFTISQSTFGSITLPDGTYNEIELKINIDGTTSAPALELNGIYNNGTTDIPVSFRVTTPLLIKAEKNNVVVSGGSLTAVTELNLALYTTGITQSMLNSATKTAGTIVISSVSNPGIYQQIVANIDRFHHAEFNHD